MWILRTVTEGLPEKTFRILPGNERTIGRATGADFIIDAALVSRVHCRVSALNSFSATFNQLPCFGVCRKSSRRTSGRASAGGNVS